MIESALVLPLPDGPNKAVTARFTRISDDVNADGLVDSTDALIVLSYDAELTLPFPVGTGASPAIVTQPAGCSP